MSGRSVVVGGCGFIGSRLAILLSAAGGDVTVLDIAPPPADLAGACAVEERDVTVPGSLQGAFDDAEVVYLAAALLAKQCDERPVRCWAVNIAGTAHVLSEVVAAGRRPRVVFLSTGMVYTSSAGNRLVPEDGPAEPDNLYARSKLAGERLVASAAAAGEFSAAVLRLFTVYGPGPASGGRGHLVAGWVECAAEGRQVTIVGDGEQTVDLTHVSDVLAACRLAAAAPVPDGECRVYNIGSGTGTRVTDLARWMQELLPSLETRSIPPPPGASPRQLGDIGRARVELGYSPSVAPEDGVKELVRARLDQAGSVPVHVPAGGI